MSGVPAAADGPTFIVRRIAVNCWSRGFDLSGSRLDMFGRLLTNSDNRRVRRGETGWEGRVAGSLGAPGRKRETNGETENARNVGQLGTCGNGYAVNRPRGKRCGERFWLRKSNAGTKTRMENLAGCGFSVLLTTTGNSEMRSQNPKNRSRPENGSLSPVRPVYHRPVSGVSPGAPNAKTRAVPPRIYRTVPLNHNWSASAQVFWRVRSLRYPQ